MSESGSPAAEGSPVIIGKMDVKRHRYPCCIVWTPLPLLSYVTASIVCPAGYVICMYHELVLINISLFSCLLEIVVSFHNE